MPLELAHFQLFNPLLVSDGANGELVEHASSHVIQKFKKEASEHVVVSVAKVPKVLTGVIVLNARTDFDGFSNQ